MVNVVLTAAKVAGLAALPILALVARRVAAGSCAGRSARCCAPVASFGIAMIAVLWTYEAWYYVTYAAGEIKDPQRNVPRALFYRHPRADGDLPRASTSPTSTRSRSTRCKGVTRIAEKAATALVGPAGATFIALTVVVSTFGCNAAGDPRRLARAVRDGAGRRVPSGREPRAPALPHAACRHRRASPSGRSLLALSGTYEQLFTYVMFASILFSVAARPRAVPPARTHARSPAAVPRVGLSRRPGRVHLRVRRLRR